MAAHTICLVGNPNCGKTTLFNALTGARQQVGNWPGVTVERKIGFYQGGGEVTVVDLPGVYSLAVTSVSSVDERIAREFVLSGEADLLVNILDASNLERNLYLTTQLLEMRVPMLVALNMVDVARDRRIRIDVAALAARLGCPVVPIVASRGDGVQHLRAEIDRAAGERRVPKVDLGYSVEIEHALTELTPLLEGVAVSPPADEDRSPRR
jgi:ferrous iron transport protein B